MTLRRLDDILNEDVDVLKLDVEGYEEKVLAGATQLLKNKRVKYLITEVNSAQRSKESCVEYVRYVAYGPGSPAYVAALTGHVPGMWAHVATARMHACAVRQVAVWV
jgi:hypothetical protein